MKLVTIEKLIDQGRFSSSGEWKRIESNLRESIARVSWPPGTNKFLLYPESGKKRGKGNGVKPIKDQFLSSLKKFGWRLDRKTIYRVDADYQLRKYKPGKYFAVEWETGNISSSHRAVNKMALGMIEGTLIGGALVLPTREMYQYLTNRVGNFSELQPYFPLWKSLGEKCQDGILLIIAVEHDGLSTEVPRIPKTTAGRALGS